MEDGKVIIEVEIDTKPFEKNLGSIKAKVDSVGEEIAKAFDPPTAIQELVNATTGVSKGFDDVSKSAKDSATAFTSAFSNTQSTVTEHSLDLKVLNSELQKIKSSTEDYASEEEKSQSIKQNLNQQIEKQKQLVGSLAEKLKESKIQFGGNAEETKQFKIELNNAEKNLNDTKTSMNGLSKETDTLGKSLKDSGKESNIFGDLLKANLASQAIIGGIKTLSSAIEGVFSFAVGGLKELAQIGVEYNSQIQDYQVNFGTLLGSQEAAIKRIEELRQMAAKYPMELEDYAKATQTLVGFGVEADKTNVIIKQIGDVSLGNAEKFQGLNLAFAQTMATGRLLGQDLNQMINQGFNPLLEISRTTGESMAQLKDRMSNGALGADEVALAFENATAEGGRFYMGMDNASKSMSGQISILKDSFNALVGEVFAPLSNMFLSELVPLSSKFVTSLQTAFSEGGIEGLAGGLGQVLADAITFTAGKIPEMVILGNKFFAGLVTGLTENQDKIFNAMAGIGDVILIALLPDDVSQRLQLSIGDIISSFDKIRTAVVDSGLLTNISTLFLSIVNSAASLRGVIAKTFDPLIVKIIEGIAGGAKILADNFKTLEFYLVQLTVAFAAYKTVMAISGLVNAFTTAMNGLTTAQKLSAIAQNLLNTAMKTNPIGILVGLIAGLVSAIIYMYNTNEDFRVAFLTAWAHILNFFEGIPLFFSGVANGIADAFGGVKTYVMNIMQGMLNGIIDIVNKGINALNTITGGSIKLIEKASFATENAIKEAQLVSARSVEYAKKSEENAVKASRRITELQAQAKKTAKEVGDNLGGEITAGAIDNIDTAAIVETTGGAGVQAGGSFSDGLGAGIQAGSSGAVSKAKDTAKEIADTQKEEFEAMAKDAEQLHKDLMTAQANIYKEDLANFEESVKNQLAIIEETTNEKKELYADERDARLEALGVETETKDTGIQNQIDAIKEASAQRKRIRDLEREQEEIEKQERAVRDAKDTEDRIQQLEKLAELEAKQQERITADTDAAKIKQLELEKKSNQDKSKEQEKAIKSEFEVKVKALTEDEKKKKEALATELKILKDSTAEKLREESLYHEASQLLLDGNQVKIQGILKDGNVKSSMLGKQGGEGFMNSLNDGLEGGLDKLDENLQRILERIETNNRRIVESNRTATNSTPAGGGVLPPALMQTPMRQGMSVQNTNVILNVVAQESISETYRNLRNTLADSALAF